MVLALQIMLKIVPGFVSSPLDDKPRSIAVTFFPQDIAKLKIN